MASALERNVAEEQREDIIKAVLAQTSYLSREEVKKILEEHAWDIYAALDSLQVRHFENLKKVSNG